MKSLHTRSKGFTLVELLVAVGIIGVLASVSMVSVNSIRGKARDSKRLSDIKQVQNALEAYYSSTGNYPAAVANAAAPLGAGNFLQLCDTALGFDTAANCTAAGRTLFMATVNANPPPDGTGYKYTPAPSAPACDNGASSCQNYSLWFTLMTATGSFEAGCYRASPDGITADAAAGACT